MSNQKFSDDEVAAFRDLVNEKLLNVVSVNPAAVLNKERYRALALTHIAREQLSRRWVKTQIADRQNQARRIYYLSMEFLIGRALNNALSALGLLAFCGLSIGDVFRELHRREGVSGIEEKNARTAK